MVLKRIKCILLVGMLAFSVFAFAACNKNNNPPATPAPERPIGFTDSGVTFERFSQRQLKLNGYSAGATFTSGDTSVMTVDASGLMTAVAEGKTTVTARVGANATAINVTVKSNTAYPVLEVEREIDVSMADGYTLSPRLTYKGERLAAAFTFTTTDTGLTVTNGAIAATAAGDYTVKVASSYAGETFEQSVAVTARAENYFYLDAREVELVKADLYGQNLPTARQLTAYTDSTAPVTYASNNPNVATVSNDGLITAVGVGNATVTATCGGNSDTVTVRVVKPTTRLDGAFDLERANVRENVDIAAVTGLSGNHDVTVTTEDGSPVEASCNGYALSVRTIDVPLGEQDLKVETPDAIVTVPVVMASMIIDDIPEFKKIETEYFKGGSGSPQNVTPEKYRDGYFILNADLDFASETGYSFCVDRRTGTDGSAFSARNGGSAPGRPQVGWYGVFDGRGHVVQNLVSGPRGMFANIEYHSEVKNVAFVGAKITPSETAEDWSCHCYFSEIMIGSIDNVLLVLDRVPYRYKGSEYTESGYTYPDGYRYLWGKAGVCLRAIGSISNTVVVITSGQDTPTDQHIGYKEDANGTYKKVGDDYVAIGANETYEGTKYVRKVDGIALPHVFADSMDMNMTDRGPNDRFVNAFALSRGTLDTVGGTVFAGNSKPPILKSFGALQSSVGGTFNANWTFDASSLQFGSYTLNTF